MIITLINYIQFICSLTVYILIDLQMFKVKEIQIHDEWLVVLILELFNVSHYSHHENVHIGTCNVKQFTSEKIKKT